MKLRRLFSVVIPVLALAMGANPSSANLTRLDDGTWFVGKGDVQSAFGWDAKTTDSKFDGVVFSYARIVVTTYDCVSGHGVNATFESTETTSQGTTRSTTFETRKNGTEVVTGAFVTLAGQPNFTGNGPTCLEGDVDNSSKDVVTTITLTATTTTSGRKGTTSAVIWTDVN